MLSVSIVFVTHSMFILTPRYFVACLTCQTNGIILYASRMHQCWTLYVNGSSKWKTNREKKIVFIFLIFLQFCGSPIHFDVIFSMKRSSARGFWKVRLPICICFKYFHVQFVEQRHNIILSVDANDCVSSAADIDAMRCTCMCGARTSANVFINLVSNLKCKLKCVRWLIRNYFISRCDCRAHALFPLPAFHL